MGLLRGVARTAAIAGTATAVSNRVSRRQGQRWAAKEEASQPPPQQYAPPPQQYAPPPQQYAPPPPQDPEPSGETEGMDRITALKELGQMRQQGVLTDAEFEAEKARILAT